MKLAEILASIPKSALVSGCVAMAIIIGIVRYLTGPEFALSLFYLFPVCLAAWYAGRTSGILIACFCALTWLTADLSMQDRFSSPIVPLTNEFLRLLVFLFAARLMDTMKRVVDIHKKTARTDNLTGIPNRFSFMEYAEMEINKARRKKRPISLIFLDVDNFKVVNDTWGHHEGDILLSCVAATLTQVIRETDFAARLGGDEFAILLWYSKNEDSHRVAIKLKDQLLKMAKRRRWPVTFSMGLITYETVPENVHVMIREADKLMYDAKKQGKNTIVRRVESNGKAGPY